MSAEHLRDWLPPDDAPSSDPIPQHCPDCGELLTADVCTTCAANAEATPRLELLDRCFYEDQDTDCAGRIAAAHREFARHGSVLLSEGDWPRECAYCRSAAGRKERLDALNRRRHG